MLYVEAISIIHNFQIVSLQISFSYKLVICQARDKVWPDRQPVWSDKKRRQKKYVSAYALDAFLDTLILDRQWYLRGVFSIV